MTGMAWLFIGLWAATVIVFAPDSLRWYATWARRRSFTPPPPMVPRRHVRVLDAQIYDWERDGA